MDTISFGNASGPVPPGTSYIDRLLAFLRLSPSQQDVLKQTGYCYADTLSYSKYPKYTSESDWLIPNMSRRTIARSSTTTSSRSSTKTSTHTNNLLARLPEQEQHLFALDDDQISNASGHSVSQQQSNNHLSSQFERDHQNLFSRIATQITSRITSGLNGTPPILLGMNGGPSSSTSSKDTILTRSQCEKGKCSAGCPLHDKRKKRRTKTRVDDSTNTISVDGDFDQHGLDVMSSDDDYINNDFSPNNFTSRTSSTPVTNGSSKPGPVPNSAASNRVRRNLMASRPVDINDDVEEITIVRRITRIFNSSESSRSSTVQRLMDMTPVPVQRITRQVTNVVPVPVILAFFLVTIITSLWYCDLIPTADGCTKTWHSFIENLFVTYSFIINLAFNCWNTGLQACSETVLFLKSSTFAIWSFLISILPSFSTSRSSNFIYSSIDDQLDAQTLIRIEEALKVYGKTLESLDSRLTDLKQEVSANKLDIEHLKKSCCKDPKELEAVIHSGVKSFWIQMFPSLSPYASDSELKDQVQEHLKKLAKDTASGVHDQQIGEFNDRFQRKLDDVTQQVLKQIQELQSRQENIGSRNEKISKIDPDDTITRNLIQRMITDAISMYDADKTGIPDFALEPSGGSVINTRCSETYSPVNRQYKIMGIPVWSTSVSPRAVIQPSIAPGECWAFKGAEGHLVIKLSREIIPTSFAYEHIPRSISRDGNIDSAPRLFQVRGLNHEFDKEGDVLGNYEYLDADTPLQTFDVQTRNPKSYRFIELIIKSNYGNPEYTCLYRFRVHGQRV